MRRALLILSGLGLLCAVIEATFLAPPSQVTEQLPDQQTLGVITTVVLVAMPFLGVIVAILGVVAADQRRAPRWRTAFIALAIISLPAYGCGFIMSILGSFPGNQGMALFATALLFFAVVIFLAALVFALRHPTRPDAVAATVSHAIDTTPTPE
ncbi:MAG: hypothetical protein ACRDID_24345 [Ktedonobacterales bacterium]